jgi:hypothetical protein
MPTCAGLLDKGARYVHQPVCHVVVSLYYLCGHVQKAHRPYSTNAAINILTDFALIILPIPVIRGLNLGRRQKIALISIFAVGGL